MNNETNKAKNTGELVKEFRSLGGDIDTEGAQLDGYVFIDSKVVYLEKLNSVLKAKIKKLEKTNFTEAMRKARANSVERNAQRTTSEKKYLTYFVGTDIGARPAVFERHRDIARTYCVQSFEYNS